MQSLLDDAKFEITPQRIKIFSLTLLLVGILDTAGVYKYIFFCFYIFVFWAANNDFKLNGTEVKIIVPSIIYVIIGLFWYSTNGFSGVYAVKDTCFFMIPPIGAFILFKSFTHEDVEDIIFCFFISSLILQIINIIRYHNIICEEERAFTFGIFSLYYLHKRKSLLVLLSILGLISANKRIALFAVIVASTLIIITSIKNKNELLEESKAKCIIYSTSIIALILSLIWIYFCKSGLLQSYFQIKRINSQGRIDMWPMFYNYFSFSLFDKGYGIGFIEYTMSNHNFKAFGNLHNDFLRSYIELGFIGYCIFILSYFIFPLVCIKTEGLKFRNLVSIISIIIYSFIIFLTDNAIIYIDFVFVMNFIMLAVALNENKEV